MLNIPYAFVDQLLSFISLIYNLKVAFQLCIYNIKFNMVNIKFDELFDARPPTSVLKINCCC